MNHRVKKIGTIVTVAVLSALAAAGALVIAQTSSGSTISTTAATAATTTFLGRVAKNLGIDQSKLIAAFQLAEEQTIDEALAAGRISEEQAANMKERLGANRTLNQLVADALASGKITQEQADLMTRGSIGSPMMGVGRMRGGPGGEGCTCGEGMGRGGRR